MKSLAIMIVCTATASADPVADTIAEQLQPMLPDNVGVARVFVPTALASANPKGIVVEVSTTLRPGRPSIKLTYKKKTLYVPVALAAMTDVAVVSHAVAAGGVLSEADFTIEHRALEGAPAPAAQVAGGTLLHELAAGTPIGAHDITLPAPSPRGMHVSVDIAHGNLHIKGSGVLELAARVGEVATVRLAYNQTVIKGTLTAPGVVVVGDQP